MTLKRIAGVVFITLVFSLITGVSLAQESVEINVAFWGSEEHYQMYDSMAQRCMELYPGIKVEILRWGDGYFDKIKLSSVSGTAPDLMYMDPAWGYSFAKNGILEDLTRYLERDDVLMDDSVVFTGAYECLRTKEFIYAVPLNLNSHIMFYNKDIFQESGLPYPDDGYRYSQEFLAAAKKITRDTSADGENDIWGVGSATMTAWSARMQNFIWPFGGEWLINEFESSYGDPGKVHLTREDTVAGLQFWADLRNQYQVTPQVSVRDDFAAGNAGMDVRGAWCIDAFQKSVNWGMAVVPGEKRTMPTFGAWGLAMSPLCKSKQEAWLVMKGYATDLESQVKFGGHAIPFLRDAAFAVDAPQAWMKTMDVGRVRFRFFDNYLEMEGKLHSELPALLNGEQSAEMMAHKLTPVLQALLDE